MVIPGLRQDRIVGYLRDLGERVIRIEHTLDLTNVEAIDLIAEGGYIAARATTEKRISRIAEIVFRGLEDATYIRRKRLLRLFGEIDDDEFLLLNAYGNQSFLGAASKAWSTVARPEPATLTSSRAQRDNEELYEDGIQHLLRLGLLKHDYGTVKRGDYPPFDPWSGGFASRIEIFNMGRMLLREAGVKED